MFALLKYMQMARLAQEVPVYFNLIQINLGGPGFY